MFRKADFSVLSCYGPSQRHKLSTESAKRTSGPRGFPKAHSCYRFCTEELGRCTGAGFDCCRPTVAGWSLDPQSAVGSLMGITCCHPANHPPPRTGAWIGGPGAGGVAPLARLGTSILRASSVRRDRVRGRFRAPALHHAARCQSTDVGLDPGSDCARIRDSVLGVFVGDLEPAVLQQLVLGHG